MPFYLAIDAGGTKTSCLLADDDRILARASTGTVKLMRVAQAEATARLTAMLHQVAAEAKVSLSQITRTCVGLAGLSSDAVRDWALGVLESTVSGTVLLCGDEEIALDAAFAGGPGVLLIAGTGSNCIGRARDGGLVRAGGWGPVLGDEGSGFWIGLQAIRAVLHQRDRLAPGEPPSILLAEIQQHWALPSLGGLIALGNLRAASETSAPPDFAALAPVVARCAEQGDALAGAVLQRAGRELAGFVRLVGDKLAAGAVDPEPAKLAIAYTGSVLTHIAPVRAAMVAELALHLPNAQVQAQPIDPLDGALWRARHA
jgi:N-acetylglucosamine kinase-like BadF-type ATPase